MVNKNESKLDYCIKETKKKSVLLCIPYWLPSLFSSTIGKLAELSYAKNPPRSAD